MEARSFLQSSLLPHKENLPDSAVTPDGGRDRGVMTSFESLEPDIAEYSFTSRLQYSTSLRGPHTTCWVGASPGKGYLTGVG